MKYLIYISVFCFISTSTAQETLDDLLKKHHKYNVPYMSVTELRMYLSQDNVTIFDSREKKEFDVSHIPSATYIGYDDFSIKPILSSFPEKNAPIVVYCTLGIRSETIGKKLIDAGYTNVKNLYGGICEWKNNNYTILDSLNSETERVHTYSKIWSKWLTNGEKVYE